MAVSCAVIRIGLFHIAIPPVLGADAVTNRDQTPGVHSPILDRSPGERSRQGQGRRARLSTTVKTGRSVLVAEGRGEPGSLNRRDQRFGTDAVRRIDGHTRLTRVEIDHDVLHAGKEQH